MGKKNGFVWVTAEGVPMRVTEMTNSHLVNTARFIDEKILELTCEIEAGVHLLTLLERKSILRIWSILWTATARLYLLRKRVERYQRAQKHIQSQLDLKGLPQIGDGWC